MKSLNQTHLMLFSIRLATRPRAVALLIAGLVFSLAATSAVASCVTITNITGWWPGDDTADDVVGTRNAILHGGALFAPGLVRGAINLDGNGQFVEILDQPELNVGTGDFTFEVWVRFNTLAGEQIIAEKYVETFSSARAGWSLTKLDDNTIRWALAGGGDVDSLPASTVIAATDVWTHIAVRRSGTTCSTFQNGVETTSGNFSRNLNSPSSLKFGHRGNPNDTPGSADTRNFWLNGSIDEPTLYVGRALSNGEIAAIYAAGAAGKCRATLTITSVQTPTFIGGLHSFVSTNPITLQATLTSNIQTTPIEWSVVGMRAAFGIAGFPSNEVRYTDIQGVSTFTFIPSTNSVFATNRRTVWATGSRTPNPPLEFDVIASVVLDGKTNISRLSHTQLGALCQDDVDTLRQEYVDFQIKLPARTNVIPSLGTGFNKGNYSLQISEGIPARFNAILTGYRGSLVLSNGGPAAVTNNSPHFVVSCSPWPWQPGTIPTNAMIVVSSGYRNPRRNMSVGSQFTGGANVSRHVFGRAFDLRPVNDPRWGLSLHDTLYPALFQAANAHGAAIAEKPDPNSTSYTPIRTCPGDPAENQIHVQW